MRAGNPKKDKRFRRKRAGFKVIGGRHFSITIDGKGIRIYYVSPYYYAKKFNRSKYERHQGEKECARRRRCDHTAEMLKTSRQLGWC